LGTRDIFGGAKNKFGEKLPQSPVPGNFARNEDGRVMDSEHTELTRASNACQYYQYLYSPSNGI